MPIQKSFVLPATFPSSKYGFESLKTAIGHIEPFDFSMVEYYCENCNADNVRMLMGERRSVFLAAALQKEKGLNLCTRNAVDRKSAVDALAECFLFAQQAGSQYVLINSGTRPEEDRYDTECLNYLSDSICELHHRVTDIDILLEPGDRDVEYRHLIGPTDMAVSFIENLRADVPCIGMLFDISHIAQLNEDLYSSWAIAKTCCTHVHLANCVLKRNSHLYGDKHLLFGVEDSVFSHEAASEFFQFLQNEDFPLTVGIEMICNENSEKAFFDRFVSETGWFFQYK